MSSRLLVIILSLFILSIFFKSGYSKLYEGDEISILKNGAIVRSRYKVEPLENLIHISVLPCKSIVGERG